MDNSGDRPYVKGELHPPVLDTAREASLHPAQTELRGHVQLGLTFKDETRLS